MDCPVAAPRWCGGARLLKTGHQPLAQSCPELQRQRWRPNLSDICRLLSQLRYSVPAGTNGHGSATGPPQGLRRARAHKEAGRRPRASDDVTCAAIYRSRCDAKTRKHHLMRRLRAACPSSHRTARAWYAAQRHARTMPPAGTANSAVPGLSGTAADNCSTLSARARKLQC